jgi:hypothetical protein
MVNFFFNITIVSVRLVINLIWSSSLSGKPKIEKNMLTKINQNKEELQKTK